MHSRPERLEDGGCTCRVRFRNVDLGLLQSGNLVDSPAGIDPAEDPACPPDPYDLLSESVVQIDAEGVIVGWNLASEELYGRDRAAAIGLIASDLFEEFCNRSKMNTAW